MLPWKKSTGRSARWSRANRQFRAAIRFWAVRGLPADAIVDNFDYGVSVAEIAEQFEVPPERRIKTSAISKI